MPCPCSKGLPKGRVELHIHLDGSLRLSTVWELSKKLGKPLPGDGSLQALTDAVVLCEPSDLSGFLSGFRYLLAPLIGNIEAIERVAYELCEDEARNGILYFECRYSPHALVGNNVTADKVVEAVNSGLAKGEKEFGIIARSILCCIIGDEGHSNEVVELCDAYRNSGVVGIDIAGDEASYGHGTDITIPQPLIDAFLEAERRGIHRTMHAGEVGSYAVVDKALHVLKAERIGHGYHVLENEQLYEETKAKEIHFEMCPHSSILTGAVPQTTLVHPIVRFAKDGANFSINCDDSSITNTWISDEIKLIQNWGLNEIHIVRAAFNAARSCFLPEDKKKELIKKLETVYGVAEI